MGKPTGFLEYERKENNNIAPKDRIKNYEEFHTLKILYKTFDKQIFQVILTNCIKNYMFLNSLSKSINVRTMYLSNIKLWNFRN